MTGRIIAITVLLICLVGITGPKARGEEHWSWEELVAVYGAAEERRQGVEDLRRELLGEVSSSMGEEELWEALWEKQKPMRRSALALSLVERLFPEGDPARWEEISGFWRPSMISRSLAALDAVFSAAVSLVEFGGEEAESLALQILGRLSRSSRARYHALLNAPEEYRWILERFGRTNPPLPKGKFIGKLPLAQPVRGWVNEEQALRLGATFLDGFGGVARGSGRYAWDRERGRIYRVRHDDDRWWFPWD